MTLLGQFFQAMREQKISEVFDLISDHPDLVNTQEGRALYPLHVAAHAGDIALAQLLLDHGADLERVDSDTRSTPLKYAVFFAQIDMVRFLVKRGARLDNTGGGSSTPLELALKATTETYREMGTPGSDQDYEDIANLLRELRSEMLK